MRLALAVQRYGADLNGGAELHARYIAQRLARSHDVEVLTTCARDYVTWRNELPPGEDQVDGIRVRRFPVDRERDPADFGEHSARVFERRHSIAEELAWLDSEGPVSGALARHIASSRSAFDYFLFFSYRYYHAFHGARAVADRAILVPTAERDSALGLGIFRPIFRGVRAVMYNSHEERGLIREVASNADVPGPVVGIGSDVPARAEPQRFRQRYGIRGPFVVYVGRIDANKGCDELFRYFQQYVATRRTPLTLLMVGEPRLPVPDHPAIKSLGYLPDRDKFDAIAASTALVMPSYFESLSMVAVEAWGLGRPVLANGRCDVLRGQCIRSNAGLYYESFDEFREALTILEREGPLREALGRHGRAFFRSHYVWPVIDRRYAEVLDHLQQEDRSGASARTIEPLPRWFARHRRTEPPAREVVDALQRGPVVPAVQRREGSRRRGPRRRRAS